MSVPGVLGEPSLPTPYPPPPPPRPHTKSRSPPSLRSLQPAAWRHGAALLSPRPAGPPRDPRTPPAPSQLGHMGAPPAALRTGQSPIAWGPPARAPSSTGDPSTGLQVPGERRGGGGSRGRTPRLCFPDPLLPRRPRRPALPIADAAPLSRHGERRGRSAAKPDGLRAVRAERGTRPRVGEGIRPVPVRPGGALPIDTRFPRALLAPSVPDKTVGGPEGSASLRPRLVWPLIDRTTRPRATGTQRHRGERRLPLPASSGRPRSPAAPQPSAPLLSSPCSCSAAAGRAVWGGGFGVSTLSLSPPIPFTIPKPGAFRCTPTARSLPAPFWALYLFITLHRGPFGEGQNPPERPKAAARSASLCAARGSPSSPFPFSP